MKVKVIKKSFYGNKLNKVGDIIEINEKTTPSWAEEVSDEVQKKESETAVNKNIANGQFENLSDEEIKEKLDELLNEAIDKGIMIDFENKSDIELIKELNKLLEECK